MITDAFKEILDLKKALVEAGIPVEEWGTGKAKTINHLFDEINAGECTLVRQEGKLIRTLRSLAINVFYRTPAGNRIILVEDKQVFTDGRVRQRSLESSLGEKLVPSEIPEHVVRRTILKELGIEGVFGFTAERPWTKGPVVSLSYPGLETFYQFFAFSVDLPDEFYRPEGYVEIQRDKTTYFVWKEQLEPPM